MRSEGVGLVEGGLCLEIDAVGDDPEVMLFERTSGDLLNFV